MDKQVQQHIMVDVKEEGLLRDFADMIKAKLSLETIVFIFIVGLITTGIVAWKVLRKNAWVQELLKMWGIK